MCDNLIGQLNFNKAEDPMGLKQKLAEMKAKSLARIPDEAKQVMAKARQQLEESGLVAKAKKAGDTAPDFTLPDTTGQMHNLRQMLGQGAVVMTFFRGGW